MWQCFFESEVLTIGRHTFVGARGGVVGAMADFGQKKGRSKQALTLYSVVIYKLKYDYERMDGSACGRFNVLY